MSERAALQTKAAPISKPPANNILQRKCECGQHTIAGGECEACNKKRLQRSAAGRSETEEAPPIVHQVLSSPGQPLDAGTRSFMESRFHHDFSRVRVHTDSKAVEAARSVNAQAFTVGQEIVFARDRYSPQSRTGKELLAHELAHVVQQRGPALSRMPLKMGEPSDEFEREADSVARDLLYPPTGLQHSVEPHLQRKIAAPEASAQEKGGPAESNYIRCLRELMDKNHWRYADIRSKHRNRRFSDKTFGSINKSLNLHLNQATFIACESDFICCGTISSVMLREAPPGTREERSYKSGYGSGGENEVGMGEEEVKVKGGSYFIDIEVDLSLKQEDCCPTTPQTPMPVT